MTGQYSEQSLKHIRAFFFLSGCYFTRMSEKPKTRAQKSVDWQNRYITPILLVLGLIIVAVSWAVDAIPWWLAVVVLGFVAYALVSMIQRNRR